MELHFDFLSKHGFDPFKGQFIISARKIIGLKNFKTKKIGSWFIQFHKAVEVLSIKDVTTEEIRGFIIGYNIISNQNSIRGSYIFKADFNKNKSIESFLSNFNNELNGRYLGVVSFDSTDYIFNDYGASMSCICDLDNGFFSSSIWLQKHLGLNPGFLESLSHVTTAISQRGYLDFFRISLMLPHSFINLSNGKFCRYKMAIINPSKPLGIIDFLFNFQEIVKHFSNQDKVNLLLSGGLDSRLLIACLTNFNSKFTVSSFHDSSIKNKNTEDNNTAIQIASKLKLSHTSINLNKDKNITVHQNLITLIGYGGELGRGYLFNKLKEMGHNKDKIESSDLLKLLQLPQIEFYQDKMEAWLQDLELRDLHQILDLFYLDFFIGHRNSPSLYQYDITCKYSFAPLITNNFIKLFLNIPADEKEGDEFFTEIIRKTCPQLLEVPFFS